MTVTQAQYDTAKDIILDLLGWGVPPDYLVNCGLSREIVYYVFIELNLRLPDDFDRSGLLPPLPYAYTHASPEPMSPPTSSRDPSRVRGIPSSKRSGGDPHPSLPKRPTAPQGTPSSADETPLSVTAAPFVPSASLSAIPMQSEDAPATPSLIDMEQQRRQELLARKAVLASRKKLNIAIAPSSSVVPTKEAKEAKETTPTSTVAPAAVDDFLKSIPPVNGNAAGKASSTPADSDDRMDVDDQIPGLSAGDASSTSQLPGSSELRSMSAEPASSAIVIFPAPPSESEGSVRSTSTERNVNPMDNSSSGSGTPQPHSAGSRRGTKRPVAADFEDMDAHSHTRHHHHPQLPHHKFGRRTHSFAGITHSRRFVIDLSDSEEEVEETVNGHRPLVSQQPSRPPTRLGASPSLRASGVVSLLGEPAAPAALAEKEQEIKRMRELIARRERARQDKLAAVSSS